MAAFDFPNAPTPGTIYAPPGSGVSFQWDGEKWVGGLIGAGGGGGASIEVSDTAPASPKDNALWYKSNAGSLWLWYEDPQGDKQWLQVNTPPGGLGLVPPVTEQFFNMTGLASTDVVVPAWAKGVTIEGAIWPSVAAGYAAMQLSLDGTTFRAGTDYQLAGGPYHNTTGGYQTQAAVASSNIYLSYPNSNLNVPHQFRTDMGLDVPVAPQLLCAHTQNQSYGSGLVFNMEWMSYLNISASPARVQKLRIICNGGTFVSGSWMKIRWHGDSSAVPTGNAIPDAPSDGGEYVRINGVWRLKSQTLNMDGATLVDVTVPPGAKKLKFVGDFWSAAVVALGARFSYDGTTFAAGASDYQYMGYYHTGNNTPTAVQNLPQSSVSQMVLMASSLTVSGIWGHIEGHFVVNRGGQGMFSGHTHAVTYDSAGTVGYNQSFMRHQAVAGFSTATIVQKVRFYSYSNSNVFGAGSTIDCEWVY